MRYRQTISKHPVLAWADIRRNGNHTVWSLTSRITASKDRIRQWELEVLLASLACLATRNRVERRGDACIGRDPCVVAVLLGIGSGTRFR